MCLERLQRLSPWTLHISHDWATPNKYSLAAMAHPDASSDSPSASRRGNFAQAKDTPRRTLSGAPQCAPFERSGTANNLLRLSTASRAATRESPPSGHNCLAPSSEIERHIASPILKPGDPSLGRIQRCKRAEKHPTLHGGLCVVKLARWPSTGLCAPLESCARPQGVRSSASRGPLPPRAPSRCAPLGRTAPARGHGHERIRANSRRRACEVCAHLSFPTSAARSHTKAGPIESAFQNHMRLAPNLALRSKRSQVCARCPMSLSPLEMDAKTKHSNYRCTAISTHWGIHDVHVYLSVKLSIHRSIDRSICLSIDMSVDISIYRYICVHMFFRWLRLAPLSEGRCVPSHCLDLCRDGLPTFNQRDAQC